MKKELKQILLICLFLIIGCVLGAIVLAVYVVAFCTAASVSYFAYKTFL